MNGPPLLGAPARSRITVRGLVQGVGFRPFVHTLATGLGLAGWVRNEACGVVVEVEGTAAALAAFQQRLQTEAPPGARIEHCDSRWLAPSGAHGFEVIASDAAGDPGATVPPDAATCAACLAEVNDPDDRHYRYPFTSCAHCGPRYSLIESMPYDRARTTLRAFVPCAACAAEYADPADRRFHAESIACPHCGPRLSFDGGAGGSENDEAALAAAVGALKDGAVVALKGLGGYQLIVRADDPTAVARLRTRKQRGDKPFAVMYPDLERAGRDAVIDEAARRLLCSPAAPVVLIPARPDSAIAATVAPAGGDLGVMLPTTALHVLLLAGVEFPLVVTSGNRAGEPLCIDAVEARTRLAGIADCFLDHDRAIARPVDDSVVAVMNGAAVVMRRARGYAPLPLEACADLDEETTDETTILGVGAALKSAVALGRRGRVVLSQHLGDLSEDLAEARFVEAVTDLQHLYGLTPTMVAHDLHPGYGSTRYAAARAGVQLGVQHHHAHIAACMADNDIDGRVLGIAWDGTGDGGDGTVWGGEFLDASRADFTRIASLRPFSLPGGDRAVREPRRVAFALLHALGRHDDEALLPMLDPVTRRNLAVMIERGINTPATTSAGRLFDGVAALLGLCDVARFEGEAAMRLERAARADVANDPSPSALPMSLDTTMTPWQLDWGPTVDAAVSARMTGATVSSIARRFHETLVEAAAAVAAASGIDRVCLSGGCFQNRVLTETLSRRLQADGKTVYTHHQVPPNDGGIALGQVVVAAARRRMG